MKWLLRLLGDDVVIEEMKMIEKGIEKVIDVDKVLMKELLKKEEWINKKDEVGIEESGKEMRNKDGSEVMNDGLEWLMKEILRLVVERGSRIVEKKERSVEKDGEGNGNEMEMEEGKCKEVLEERSVIEMRMLKDELMRMGKIGRLDDIIIDRVRKEIEDIIGNSELKKIGMLREIGDGVKKRMFSEKGNIMKIEKDN